MRESLLSLINYQKGCPDMKKLSMIGSLVFSLILSIYFVVTGDETVLALVLLGLLVSFISAMMLLTKK